MNVYVRELVSSLSQAGVECTTFTRADREGLPSEVMVEPGHRVVYIEAGPHHLPKEALPDISDLFCHGVIEWIKANEALIDGLLILFRSRVVQSVVVIINAVTGEELVEACSERESFEQRLANAGERAKQDAS